MARVLVVDSLEACNIPQSVRRVLRVKPYVKATCGSEGAQEYETQINEEADPEGPETSKWTKPFEVRLPDEQDLQATAVVKFRLFMSRSLKPDKELASVRVPVADFRSTAEKPVINTYKMKFRHKKHEKKAQGTKIELRLKAHVGSATGLQDNHPPGGNHDLPESTNGGRNNLAKVGAAVITFGIALATGIANLVS